ncbi:MAG: pyridoxine 5'-phosphate synthase [Alphaproteobacteria bacterium]|nr:pyridoxine 5'-phosphate synthase [Alphaproteobacteria bacterium]
MSERPYLRLGVNIDHVATVRNARGGAHPDPVAAAMVAIEAGADGITAHLREDRRHIRDEDITRLKATITRPLNFEMAATDEMIALALATRPNAACIVPEKREEVTTEGGLDVISHQHRLTDLATALGAAGIRVSMFVEADARQLEACRAIGADIVELHTGRYCDTAGAARAEELERIKAGAKIADELGMECHAGHGLGFDTVGPVAAIPQLHELNIGHFLIGAAITMGLPAAVQRMRGDMDKARA